MTKFLSITQRGGLPTYLDLPEQLAKHNNNGSKQWIEWRKLGLSKSKLASLYGVSRQTITAWIAVEDTASA